MYQKFDGRKKERQTNYELLGQCMFDSGNELGPGTAYGEIIVSEQNLLAVMDPFPHPLVKFSNATKKKSLSVWKLCFKVKLDVKPSQITANNC